MQISITNYRNINQLGIEVEEGKVNYLFGVCGSGKSSILDAISKPFEAKDATVGADGSEPVVTVDGNPPQTDAATLYSIEKHSVLFGAAPNEDCYRVFVGDESELLAHEAAFHESIDRLRSISAKIVEMRNDVDALAKEIGKPAKSGKFTGASKLCKAHSVMSNATGRAREAIGSGEYAYLEWRANGFTINGDFDNGLCPFCGQTIEGDRAIELSEIRELTAKELKPVFASSPIMGKLGFQNPNFSDEAEFTSLKERLERLFKARAQIDLVLQYSNISNGMALLKDVPKGLELDAVVYEFVPDLRALVEDVNARRDELSGLMGRMAADLKIMIARTPEA